MAIKLHELQVVFSGGAGIESPEDAGANLGGARSTAVNNQVISQTAAGLAMTGIAIVDAYGNPEGNGSLNYVHNGGVGRTLGWRHPGGVTYYGQAVDAGGLFLIGSSSGYLLVNVTTANLPSGDQLGTITIANSMENVFPLVPASESLLGSVEYRCLYVLNDNGVDTAQDVRIWLDENTPAGDTIEIGLDPAGLNSTAATIPDGQTAPAGVTFSAPSSYATALVMGNIPAGQHYAFWQRRTVPPETRGTVISNGAVIGIAATV